MADGAARATWWKRVRKVTTVLLAIGAVLFILVAVFLLTVQRQLIYHPRGYGADWENLYGPHGIALEYRTSAGNQTAYYIPPSDSETSAPLQLWVFFGGNASVALDWMDFIENYPHRRTGFLLIDYPGYGKSEGAATPKNALESAEGAVDALAARLNMPREELAKELGVVGHSLGAAMALQFSARHPVRRAVLIAPFTSLKDMAGVTVGPVLKHLLLHQYDNRARLRELAARPEPPKVLVLHGTADQVIPVAQGRELAAAHPNMIRFVEKKDVDHVWILWGSKDEIWEFMMEGVREGESRE